MKTFRFEGHSDDTFGEYGITNDDFDNCASGNAIEWVITAPSAPGTGLVVVGQHCPGRAGTWLIGIAGLDPNFDDSALPPWYARFSASQDPRHAYKPALLIDVPDDAELRCVQRDAANTD